MDNADAADAADALEPPVTAKSSNCNSSIWSRVVVEKKSVVGRRIVRVRQPYGTFVECRPGAV